MSYQCDICNKEYKKIQGLRVHKGMVHAEQKKKKKKPKLLSNAPPSIPSAPIIHFCPNCGFHLGVLSNIISTMESIHAT